MPFLPADHYQLVGWHKPRDANTFSTLKQWSPRRHDLARIPSEEQANELQHRRASTEIA